jgi:hypothetical protein
MVNKTDYIIRHVHKYGYFTIAKRTLKSKEYFFNTHKIKLVKITSDLAERKHL